ncbi:hypothetical protein PEBR_18328 [Penicillium brasilianum]|uniref:Microbial-type PARG catalytic domain-containing protein n=1 Tax=Penicillium brasilianum TaxID=104259 RepID=A0A1S9RNM7_PENBI|nr:hypothetical protein PEBR_18328 [Penicillium brasilianum]
MSKPPNKIERQGLAAETQSLTPAILNTTSATNEAVLYSQLLPALSPTSTATKPKLSVVNMDSFTAARSILDANPSAKIGVLNMASEKNPGGGWLRGALAQEEALCMRSTLAATLYKRFYPIPVLGAIWSPNVAVFRDEIGSWGRVYQPDEIFSVGVISLPALRRPALTMDKKRFARPQDVEILKNKMRQIFRILAQNKITHCVLGAMGCGAFQNPPAEVARIYKEVLEESEWNGVFEEIMFAVLDTRGESNYALFSNALVPTI